MYITITAQKMGGNYSQSSADFVGYLETVSYTHLTLPTNREV